VRYCSVPVAGGNAWITWVDALECGQVVLNGSPNMCAYHLKLTEGLLADSFGRYHATPATRPKLTIPGDGWQPAHTLDELSWDAVPGTLYEEARDRGREFDRTLAARHGQKR
jgi:hypothetical protein